MTPMFQAGHTYLCTDALRQAHRRAAEQAARDTTETGEDASPKAATRTQRVAGLMALVLSCGLVGTAVFVGDALAQRVA